MIVDNPKYTFCDDHRLTSSFHVWSHCPMFMTDDQKHVHWTLGAFLTDRDRWRSPDAFPFSDPVVKIAPAPGCTCD